MQKTIVLISNSYGINIFVRKLEEIIKAVRKGDEAPELWFICSTRNKSTHKYANYLQFISKKHSWINVLNFFSEATTQGIESETHSISGAVSLDEIRKHALIESSEIHLSGIDEFIETLTKGLLEAGVKKSSINNVPLGQGILEFANNLNTAPLASQTTNVIFNSSNTSTPWSMENGSLLETAEAIGLTPPFSCRSGNCGKCLVQISQGNVCYDRQPEAVPKAGEILLCCSRPSSDSDELIINI